MRWTIPFRYKITNIRATLCHQISLADEASWMICSFLRALKYPWQCILTFVVQWFSTTPTGNRKKNHTKILHCLYYRFFTKQYWRVLTRGGNKAEISSSMYFMWIFHSSVLQNPKNQLYFDVKNEEYSKKYFLAK